MAAKERDRDGSRTSNARPFSKRTASGSAVRPSAGLANRSAATAASLARMRRQASAAAAPFRSVPLDAAVGDVLLFLSVAVADTRIRSYDAPSSSATIW